jgi:hypothetical protein
MFCRAKVALGDDLWRAGLMEQAGQLCQQKLSPAAACV